MNLPYGGDAAPGINTAIRQGEILRMAVFVFETHREIGEMLATVPPALTSPPNSHLFSFSQRD